MLLSHSVLARLAADSFERGQSLAVGAAYSSRQHPGNQDDAAEFFGFRAKALLDIEIDSPTLATAQALLILSAHEAARARDSRGNTTQ